jgi:phage terminase large subunit-like protein
MSQPIHHTRAWTNLRAQWATHLANIWANQLTYACPTCHQPIEPTHEWDLGHSRDTPAVFGYEITGEERPQHRACNRSDSRAIAQANADRQQAIARAAHAIQSGDPLSRSLSETPHRDPRVSPRDGGGGGVPEFGPQSDDPVWQSAPWLASLFPVPAEATWPRFMTVPHPAAVGSLGGEFEAWCVERFGAMRWFQRLIAFRVLEVDASGHLVWDVVIWTMARQLGKSWLLRALLLWRIQPEQVARFGEAQTVVHTAKDLDSANECQMPVRLMVRECTCGGRTWVDVAGRRRSGHEDDCSRVLYKTSDKPGEYEVRYVSTFSRWLVRAQNSVYGKGASVGAVDEGWKVKPSTVDDGLEATAAERSNPQLYLISTAHRKATALMPTRRNDALTELSAPVSTLIIEWSVRPGSDVEDPATWRQASPHWSPQRERIIRRKLASALRGDVVEVDPDEPDPMESFNAQWLNTWPDLRKTLHGSWLASGVWANQPAAERPGDGDEPVVLAVEGTYLRRVSIVGARLGDGRVFHVWTQDKPSDDEVETVLTNARDLWDVQEIVHRAAFRKKLFKRLDGDGWQLHEWDDSVKNEAAATSEFYRAIEARTVPHDHHPVIEAHQRAAVGRVNWRRELVLARPMTGEAADAAFAARNAWWRAVQLSDEGESDNRIY